MPLRVSFVRFLVISFAASLLPAQAAWKIDPDFRPLPSFGYSIGFITAVQSDGKLIISDGAERLNPDGSKDASYVPDISKFVEIWIAPSGQLIGVKDDELFWLTASGETTATRVSLNDGYAQLAGFLSDGRLVIFGGFSGVKRRCSGRCRASQCRRHARHDV